MKLSLFIITILSAVGLYQLIQYHDHKIFNIESLTSSNLIKIQRNKETGIMEIYGDSSNDIARGLGYIHAYDRLVQMELVRIAAKGELSQDLKVEEDTINTDLFFREMGFNRISKNYKSLSPIAREYVENYISGINQYLDEMTIKPLEFYMVGYEPTHWTIDDCIAVGALLSFFGLASNQLEVEKTLIEVLQNPNTNVDILKEVFSPYLNEIDFLLSDEDNHEDIFTLINNLNIQQSWIGENYLYKNIVSGPGGSNNWIVSGKASATGGVIMSSDPHLSINRLPPFWMEYYGYIRNNNNDLKYQYGASIPGLPGFIIGRTNDIAYSITYGFMDQVDYFFEEIKDGKYRSYNNEWKPINIINEKIYKKGEEEPINMRLYYTNNGIIERNYEEIEKPIKDGLYLSRAWVGTYNVFHKIIESTAKVLDAKNVNEVKNILKDIPISMNVLTGDRDGHIGFQMTGAAPIRGDGISGLLPVPGWDERFKWKGIVPSDELATWETDDGFLVTANGGYNRPDRPHVVNLHAGFYRHNLITNYLSNLSINERTIDEMKNIQCSTYSEFANKWLYWIKNNLNKEPSNDLLNIKERRSLRNKFLSWNANYDIDSKEALIWNELYNNIKKMILTSNNILDENIYNKMNVIPMTSDYDHYWETYLYNLVQTDKLYIDILNNEWLKLENKYINLWEESGLKLKKKRMIINENEDEDLLENDTIWELLPTYGDENIFHMKNIFFNGQLPSFLGYDRNDMKLPGHGTTIRQGQLFQYRNHDDSFAPSYRLITDLSTDVVESILPGGQSGRRFSSYYQNEIDRWDICEYKTIEFFYDSNN